MQGTFLFGEDRRSSKRDSRFCNIGYDREMAVVTRLRGVATVIMGAETVEVGLSDALTLNAVEIETVIDGLSKEKIAALGLEHRLNQVQHGAAKFINVGTAEC